MNKLYELNKKEIAAVTGSKLSPETVETLVHALGLAIGLFGGFVGANSPEYLTSTVNKIFITATATLAGGSIGKTIGKQVSKLF